MSQRGDYGLCFDCRLLKVVYEKSGRCLFRCARREEPIPPDFVWDHVPCPGFEP